MCYLASVKTAVTCAVISFTLCLGAAAGKKQDLWYVVDLLTGEKQQTLTSSYAEMLCPSSSLLYLGRTGESAAARKHPQCSQPAQSNRGTGSSAATFVLHSLTSTSRRHPSLPPVPSQPPSSSHDVSLLYVMEVTCLLRLCRIHHHHVRHKEQRAALECHLFRLCLHTS